MVLQLADKSIETLPVGTKVSVLDAEGNVLATNTAKTNISVARGEDAEKYGATTTFIYDNAEYDGASWKTTQGSIGNLEVVKKVKIEYSIDGTSYTKTVEVEAYVTGE